MNIKIVGVNPNCNPYIQKKITEDRRLKDKEDKQPIVTNYILVYGCIH